MGKTIYVYLIVFFLVVPWTFWNTLMYPAVKLLDHRACKTTPTCLTLSNTPTGLWWDPSGYTFSWTPDMIRWLTFCQQTGTLSWFVSVRVNPWCHSASQLSVCATAIHLSLIETVSFSYCLEAFLSYWYQFFTKNIVLQVSPHTPTYLLTWF